MFIEARRLEIRYNLTKSWNAIWEDSQELPSLNQWVCPISLGIITPNAKKLLDFREAEH